VLGLTRERACLIANTPPLLRRERTLTTRERACLIANTPPLLRRERTFASS